MQDQFSEEKLNALNKIRRETVKVCWKRNLNCMDKTKPSSTLNLAQLVATLKELSVCKYSRTKCSHKGSRRRRQRGPGRLTSIKTNRHHLVMLGFCIGVSALNFSYPECSLYTLTTQSHFSNFNFFTAIRDLGLLTVDVLLVVPPLPERNLTQHSIIYVHQLA